MKLKTIKNLFLAGSLGLLLSSCASIVNGSTETFNIKSDPTHAKIEVKNIITGQVINVDETPAKLTLKRSEGFFQGARYQVTVSKAGYKPFSFFVTPHVAGSYAIGNLFFGGFLGYLVVDPLTGGMWNLEVDSKEVQKYHEPRDAYPHLYIKLLEDTTAEERARMKKIN